MRAALNTKKIFGSIFLIIAFSCQKELKFETHLAKGTLKDVSGTCFPQIQYGTFYNGVAPNSEAYIEVKVNVISAGSYSIFTDTKNGLHFADSGRFTTAGINIIQLKPTGIPIAPRPTDFLLRFDTSFCPLRINVSDSAALNNTADTSHNNWKFTDTKRRMTYQGIFENNYILKFGSYNVLVLSTKYAEKPGDSTFIINIGLRSETITIGSYSTDDIPTGIVFRTFSDACVNCAGGGLIPLSSGASVRINITDYNPLTRIVLGNFSGTTIDFFNEIAEIKGGEFSAAVK